MGLNESILHIFLSNFRIGFSRWLFLCSYIGCNCTKISKTQSVFVVLSHCTSRGQCGFRINQAEVVDLVLLAEGVEQE